MIRVGRVHEDGRNARPFSFCVLSTGEPRWAHTHRHYRREEAERDREDVARTFREAGAEVEVEAEVAA